MATEQEGHTPGEPNADGVYSGSVYIGEAAHTLRNGSRSFILKWEAVRRPMRVCEGGGWYSAHPTIEVWEYRSWMEHKSAPGWSWPKIAQSYHENDISELIARDIDRALVRHGFTTDAAIARATGEA